MSDRIRVCGDILLLGLKAEFSLLQSQNSGYHNFCLLSKEKSNSTLFIDESS